jgi:hypothetical protein
MKKSLAAIALLLLSGNMATAQNFNDYFQDKTLRIDYIFSETETRSISPWTSCLWNPVGTASANGWPNFPSRATDKSPCVTTRPDR